MWDVKKDDLHSLEIIYQGFTLTMWDVKDEIIENVKEHSIVLP